MFNYIIGVFAGIGTTISFIPQVIKIYKTRNTTDISPIMFCIHTTGVVAWVVYGIFEQNYVIIVFNSITCLLCVNILYFIVQNYKYGNPNLSHV
jgi:MtN3 and saliva related transmembrane protein